MPSEGHFITMHYGEPAAECISVPGRPEGSEKIRAVIWVVRQLAVGPSCYELPFEGAQR